MENVAPRPEDLFHESPKVRHRYLLLSPIPTFVDKAGGIWLDDLWHKDFARHFPYIEQLTLASPVVPLTEETGLSPLQADLAERLTLVALPSSTSFAQAIKDLPRLSGQLWKAVGSCDILHSSVVGWPIPPGWIGNSIALMRRKKLVMVVESAPWRRFDAVATSFKHRLRNSINEYLAKFFVGAADITFVTHPGYETSFRKHPDDKIYVTPASWIDAANILSSSVAAAQWQQKSGEPVRFLFAGRLHPHKGVAVLLEALALADQEGVHVAVDFIGEGELREQIVATAARLKTVKIRALEPVSYGEAFMGLLQQYHAVIVPSVSDEQPRIIFDAFSQAVPLVASNTLGLSSYISDEGNGFLCPPGDVAGLKDVLVRLTHNPATLRDAGLRARESASRYTHEAMHAHRHKLLLQAFG